MRMGHNNLYHSLLYQGIAMIALLQVDHVYEKTLNEDEESQINLYNSCLVPSNHVVLVVTLSTSLKSVVFSSK